MLRLTFTDRPLNSIVVNAANGQIMYDVKTPQLRGGSTTTVRDARGDVVAKYESSAYTHELTIRGERRDLNGWLEREHTLSLCVPSRDRRYSALIGLTRGTVSDRGGCTHQMGGHMNGGGISTHGWYVSVMLKLLLTLTKAMNRLQTLRQGSSSQHR